MNRAHVISTDFHDDPTNARYERLIEWLKGEQELYPRLNLSINPEFIAMNRFQDDALPYAVMESTGLVTIKQAVSLRSDDDANLDCLLFRTMLSLKASFHLAITKDLTPGQEINLGHALKASELMRSMVLNIPAPDTFKLRALEQAARNLLASVPGAEHELRSILDA